MSLQVDLKNDNIWIRKISDEPVSERALEKHGIMLLIARVFDYSCAHNASRIMMDKRNPIFLCLKDNKPPILGALVAERKQTNISVAYLLVKKDYRNNRLGTRLMFKIFDVALKERLRVTLEYNPLKLKRCVFYTRLSPVEADSQSLLSKLFFPNIARPLFDPSISLAAVSSNQRSIPPGRHIRFLNSAQELYTFKFIQLCLYCAVTIISVALFDCYRSNP